MGEVGSRIDLLAAPVIFLMAVDRRGHAAVDCEVAGVRLTSNCTLRRSPGGVKHLNAQQPSYRHVQNGLILLLQTFQPVVEVIEVAEDLAKALVVLGELGVDPIKPPVDGLKPPVDFLELPAQELD